MGNLTIDCFLPGPELAEGLEDVEMAEKSISRILQEGWEKLESYHHEIDQGEDVGHAGATSGVWSSSAGDLFC